MAGSTSDGKTLEDALDRFRSIYGAVKTLPYPSKLTEHICEQLDSAISDFASSLEALKESEGAALEEPKKTLEELRVFANERQEFGIQTEVQCRPDPENPRSKGNRTGEAYGGGYEEASRHFKNEIDRRLAEINSLRSASSGGKP
jgi:hypothetical protein